MSNDQAVFSFELNESLYFEKGQEVEEIRGIALDPEISIQPFNEYISIRGVIELRGEYVKANGQNQEQNNTVEFDEEYHARRYMERVEDLVEGGAEFSHRFPVEISVPTYRVGDLEDVTVSINSFDYELPTQNQITFASTIAIHGISEQEESPRDEPAYDYQADDDHTFDFDIKEPQELESPFDSESSQHQDMPILSTESETLSEPSSSPDRWKHEKTQSFAEFFKQPEPEVESSVSPSTLESPYAESDVEPSVEASYSPEYFSVDESSRESQADPSSLVSPEVITEITDSKQTHERPQINENAELDGNQPADVRYLSDMFRNEEEHFSSMRVCIVQDRDTLETIADRYKITTMQLMKQNRLEDDTVSEGQILYIPTKKR
ncbi:stage VI sporulation protein D [Lentibacillus sp. N15]|uniref:stage VI sporulation protein D n=1 Tax=Lentibacillus songyuanensis TaxID=3136161 RepID=UPI0031B9ED7E